MIVECNWAIRNVAVSQHTLYGEWILCENRRERVKLCQFCVVCNELNSRWICRMQLQTAVIPCAGNTDEIGFIEWKEMKWLSRRRFVGDVIRSRTSQTLRNFQRLYSYIIRVHYIFSRVGTLFGGNLKSILEQATVASYEAQLLTEIFARELGRKIPF